MLCVCTLLVLVAAATSHNCTDHAIVDDKVLGSLVTNLLRLERTVALMSTKQERNSKELEKIQGKYSKELEKKLEKNSKEFGEKLERNSKELEGKLERNANELEKKLQRYSKDISSLKSDLGNKEGLLINMTQSIAKMQTDVAYEVTLPSDMTETTLKFTNVRYNKGGGYRSSTGIFTAPVSGTYMFWAHIMVNGKDRLYVYMYKGRDEIGRGYSRPDANHGSGFASISTVTELKKGDQVWLSKASGSLKIEGNHWSSYGGTLLRVN